MTRLELHVHQQMESAQLSWRLICHHMNSGAVWISSTLHGTPHPRWVDCKIEPCEPCLQPLPRSVLKVESPILRIEVFFFCHSQTFMKFLLTQRLTKLSDFINGAQGISLCLHLLAVVDCVVVAVCKENAFRLLLITVNGKLIKERWMLNNIYWDVLTCRPTSATSTTCDWLLATQRINKTGSVHP